MGKDFSGKIIRAWIPETEEDYESARCMIGLVDYDFVGYQKAMEKSRSACSKLKIEFRTFTCPLKAIQLAIQDMGLELNNDGYCALMKSDFPDEELELQALAIITGFGG